MIKSGLKEVKIGSMKCRCLDEKRTHRKYYLEVRTKYKKAV